MKKTRALRVLTCGAIALSAISLPTPLYASTEAPEYYASGGEHKGTYYDGEFFANGTPITISKNAGGQTEITWDGGSQVVEDDDMIFAGSNCVGTTSNKANVNLATTSVIMNSGKIHYLSAGNKVKNETTCDESKVGTARLDINGGEIDALFGNDNQNAAFGNDVAKELNGKSYKNYAIDNLIVTIDGANVKDFRGVTSYTYANRIDVTVGKDVAAELGILIWGTNGFINEGNFTMYSGKTEVGQSNYRAVMNSMNYNILGGTVGNIYVGSYYPEEETSTAYWYKNSLAASVGGVNYGFANKTIINVAKGAKYNDIISGFQYRTDEVSLFKTLYPNELWRIHNINQNAPVTLNLATAPSATTLDKNTMIDAANATTNWKASSVTLDTTSKTLNVGENFTLKATLDLVKAPAVTFSSSNKNVAIVDKNGKVTAVGNGNATIHATSGDVSADCAVTVNELQIDIPNTNPSKPVESVTPSVSEKSVEAVSKELASIIDSIVNGGTPNGLDAKTLKNVKEAIQAGKAITPKISASAINKKDVKENDVKKIEAVLNDNAIIAQYLDFSVELHSDGKTLGNINEFSNKLTFTITTPKELKKDGRTFYVVRLHNNVAQKLATVMNADGTLSFETDKLSTYALVYEDTNAIDPVNPDKGATTLTKPDKKTTKPNTGDATNFLPYAIALLGSVIVLIALVQYKRVAKK